MRASIVRATFVAGTLLSGPSALLGQEGGGPSADRRVGLEAGWNDAESASWNLELVAHLPRPDGFFDPEDPGSFDFANTDLAFSGNLLIQGSYHGFQIYDISNPAAPRLRTAFVCPGGQGDVSVFGDLLFVSVQETRSRIDCGTQGAPNPVDPERFRGVRIFDISNPDVPRQVAAVQSCRGSHTHTLIPDPDDDQFLYLYISGTSVPRSGAELAGCSNVGDDPNTSFFRIEVVRIPLAAPHEARIVSEPRIFADPETGAIAGLWPGGGHGEGTQVTSQTQACHDITAYPVLGLAAGACQGNGLLFNITDPENPVRIDAIIDPNFAYWHSATFNNDGTKVLFTDEWGGGVEPRCMSLDPPLWGANAIFRLQDGRFHEGGYYKLPAPQSMTENCVAHNGSLVPVPGRDIKVQAWYQGGISVFDFTDPGNIFEVAYFDRGPLSETDLMLGGYWSAYWYNGYIYGSEIARGLDVFRLTPSEQVSANELAAAESVVLDGFNAQVHPRLILAPSFVMIRARVDQLARSEGISAGRIAEIREELVQIERSPSPEERGGSLDELAARLHEESLQLDAQGTPEARSAVLGMRAVVSAVRDLAGTLR